MTKKMIDAEALLKWVHANQTEDDGETGCYVVDSFYLEEKINELATPAPEPQKQEIIDFYVAFKDTIEAELVKPLEDSLVGITADNAYIAGLQTALRLADESAKYVIDKLRELRKETK